MSDLTRISKNAAAAVGAAFLLLCGANLGDAGAPGEDSFEQNGFRVTMVVHNDGADAKDPVLADTEAKLEVRIVESMGAAKPLTGLRPLAWLARRDEGEAAPDRDACEYQIRSFLSGRLARTPEVNLNEYLLATLDENNSISIVDPQVESSKTKTLGMVSLPGIGADFALAYDRRNIIVSLPDQGTVAIVDTIRRRARYVEVGGRPYRVRMQPDGRFAWIGDERDGLINVVDTVALGKVASVDAGPGPHDFEFSGNSRYVYVLSPASDVVSVIDTTDFRIAARLEIDKGAHGFAYSARSGRLYVIAGGEYARRVLVVDPSGENIRGSIEFEHRVTGVYVTPDGRHGIALHGYSDRVSIFETASNSVVHAFATGPEPYRVGFSEDFAYIEQAGTGDVLLVELGGLSEGRTEPRLTPVVMRRTAPGSRMADSIAPTLQELPEGGGVFVLSTTDRAIYHYMEGMNAPMGAYQTYPWPARGLLVMDRTIRESGDGMYETEFRTPGPGTYTLHFLVPESPKLFGCRTVEISAPEGAPVPAPPLGVQRVTLEEPLHSGRGNRVAVRVTAGDPPEPVEDLNDLMFLVLSGPRAQWRGLARSVGDGLYEAEVVFAEPGRYMLMVASRSRGVEFGTLPPTVLWVSDEVVEGRDGEVLQ